MYRRVELNDHDWDEDLVNFKYIGRTLGCGCCVSYEGITLENINEHIADLEEMLEQARNIRDNL